MVAAIVIVLIYFAASTVFDFRKQQLNISVDSSIESLLPSSGAALETYQNIRKRFVGDDFLIVAWIANDIFTPERLAGLKQLTRAIEKVPDVTRVDSLATATYVRAEDDFTNIDEFLIDLPQDLAAAQALKADALANPLFAGHLVSRDGTGAVLAVHLQPGLSTADLSDRVNAISAASKQFAGDTENFVTGPIVARIETGRTLFSDIRIVFPLAVFATVFISLIGHRSINGILLPLSVNAISLLATVAIFVSNGNAFNFVTIIMPPVIFVVGFAYAIHIVSDFERLVGLGMAKPEAIRESLDEVFVPLTLTAFTTAVGFASLVISNIETIKVFGLYSALGTLLSWAFSILIVPIGLRLLPTSRPNSGAGRLVSYAPAIAKFDLKHRQAILFTGFLLGVFAVGFASKINIGTDYLNNFPPGSEVRKNFNAIGEVFSGAVPIQVYIETDIPDVFKHPERLVELDKLQKWFKRATGNRRYAIVCRLHAYVAHDLRSRCDT